MPPSRTLPGAPPPTTLPNLQPHLPLCPPPSQILDPPLEAVAKGLLLQNSVGIQAIHARVLTENAALPHNILPLSSLPMYNKNSEQCTSICRNPCKNYYKVCSDTAKNQIVSMCGLKLKQSSRCLVKHIVQ